VLIVRRPVPDDKIELSVLKRNSLRSLRKARQIGIMFQGEVP